MSKARPVYSAAFSTARRKQPSAGVAQVIVIGINALILLFIFE